MSRTLYQKRLLAADHVDSIDILEEIGLRLTKIQAYPPILPYVGAAILETVEETRQVIAERMSDDAIVGADDSDSASDGS